MITKETLAYFWQQIIARIENSLSKKYSTTITATWTGSAAPYSQSITVTGIAADDNPVVDLTFSGTYATDQTRLAEWSKIYRIVTAADTIIVYATEPTTVELPIQLQVVK